MAQVAVTDYLKLIPAVRGGPAGYLWSSYDAEADVLYVNFKKPSHATGGELTDDVIVRHEGDEVVGLRSCMRASGERAQLFAHAGNGDLSDPDAGQERACLTSP